MTELEEKLIVLQRQHAFLEKRLSYFFGSDWNNPTAKDIVKQLEENEQEQHNILQETK